MSAAASAIRTPRGWAGARPILAVSLGNALEFYDFMVYAFFAIQIGKAFFPLHDPYASLMASLATFGAGFVTRPLGAWLLGGYGDRHGRGPALMLSMALMGAAMLLLVLCPGYASIGFAAPVIAVLARLLQGFALGGEVGPATAYMLESAAPQRRGLVVSLQRGTQLVAGIAGSLAGLVLSWALPPAAFEEWGWRIALGLGVAIIPYALAVRRNLPEPPHENSGGHPAEHPPGLRLTPGLTRTIVCGAMIMTAGTIGAYILTYMATFAQASLKLSPTIALAGQLTASFVALIATVLGGWLSDRTGRRAVMIPAAGLAIVASPIVFGWFTRAADATSFIVGASVIAFLSALPVSAGNAAIAESLPRAVRARAFALIYTLPVTIFGGTTQLVVTWLMHVTGRTDAVVWYSVAGMVVGLVAVIFLRESAPARLYPRRLDGLSPTEAR
ncbi:MAG: MFS transporter [Novosphingobium sp.]